ncbi:MAG: hypothetical protein AAFZ17_04650 [Cyanobacteria bacterium J06650_10]
MRYIEESSNNFIALFPHRYDFIYAPHPEPKQKPNWHSESRYPLSDRQLLKGEHLYGVRFEQKTRYLLLDIDHSSPYHPSQDPLVLDRLFLALEDIGLISHIICISSDSQGLHIYFPFNKTFNSWKIAKAATTALENAGFKLKPGQLEIFPNPKNYSTDGTPGLFNAHRLPLQMGSYILDETLNPTNSSKTHFVHLWKFCQRKNVLHTHRIRVLLRQSKQLSYRLSNKAKKFLTDLDTEIEEGWTEQGQTNRLLGRITMRTFVFNHVTEGGEPLTGADLIDKVVEVAKSLPGYKSWCRHQHEIEQRATEWVRCIENSHYFPYGTAKGKYKTLVPTTHNSELTTNQKKARETRQKITAAVQALKEKNKLPEGITARFKALLEQGIGGGSLYRYRDLWHPIAMKNTEKESGLHCTVHEDACTGGANVLKNPTSLLSENGGNSFTDKRLSDSLEPAEAATGSNSPESPQAIRDRIRKQLLERQQAPQQQQAPSEAVRDADAEQEIQKRAIQRMREFLASGEPILLIEVGHWLAKQSTETKQALVLDEDEDIATLLEDLAVIALRLAIDKRSPWDVRLRLEEDYGKSLILELTPDERTRWIQQLSEPEGGENATHVFL